MPTNPVNVDGIGRIGSLRLDVQIDRTTPIDAGRRRVAFDFLTAGVTGIGNLPLRRYAGGLGVLDLNAILGPGWAWKRCDGGEDAGAHKLSYAVSDANHNRSRC